MSDADAPVPVYWLASALTARGFAPARIATALDLDLADLSDRDAHASAERYLRLLDAAAIELDDAFLGLHLAETAEPSAFGLFGYLVTNAPTLRDVCLMLGHYHPIFTRAFGLAFRQEGGQGHFDYTALALPGVDARQDIDFTLAIVAANLRRMTAEDWSPSGCTLTVPAPPSLEEHHRIFGPHVRFGAAQNRLSFSADILRETRKEADPSLFAVLRHQADALFAALPEDTRDRLADHVRLRLSAQLGVRVPSADEIASDLHMSTRQLHRRLTAEGTTYRELRKEVVYSAAREALAFSDDPVTEIALHLGYAETSSFTRAFSKHHGMSPRAYRRQARGE